MIYLKNPKEIKIMRAGGRIAAAVLQRLITEARVGVSTEDLDQLAEGLVRKAGGEPSFKMEPHYHRATCINLNEGVVHGIPSQRRIEEGDTVTLDLGVFYRGFHSDTAWTFPVGGRKDKERERFLATGEKALEEVIRLCRLGNFLGDLSAKISEVVEGAGYSVVRELAGHGVGRELHEDPLIPGFGEPGTGPELVEGMTLALEIIYAQGRAEIVLGRDGWTFVTVDGKIAGLFEHSVALTEKGPLVLTAL